MEQHEGYMRKCIELATIAKHRGDSPVGSIIVCEDTVVGQGIEGNKTHSDITFHGEIEAVRDAVKRPGTQDLSNCTLYTTHEPCIMCSYVIRHARIKTVVPGLTIGETGGFSSRYPLLRDDTIGKWGAPPEVIARVLEKVCAELNN